MPPSTIVLLVDDDGDTVDLIWQGLRKRAPGVVLFALNSVEEALRVLDTVKPHIILADYWMPEMDGLRFLERTRKEAPGAEVVLFSGALTPELEAQARRQGVQRFLRKPIEFDTLLRLIRELSPVSPAVR